MIRSPEQILNEYLVLQAQNGDTKSIEQLVRSWNGRFIRFAFQITSHRETAADVVQESWISIMHGIRKIKDPANFQCWAYRIVHNKSYDAVRTKIKDHAVREEYLQVARTTTPSPFETSLESDQSDDIELLRVAIARFKLADQLVLTLFYEEGLSLKEIRQITGASISALKSRLHQIRRRLKTILERKKNEQQQY